MDSILVSHTDAMLNIDSAVTEKMGGKGENRVALLFCSQFDLVSLRFQFYGVGVSVNNQQLRYGRYLNYLIHHQEWLHLWSND